MYTPRRTKLLFKIIFEEDPVPIARAQLRIKFATCIFPNIRKKILAAPLPNLGYAYVLYAFGYKVVLPTITTIVLIAF